MDIKWKKKAANHCRCLPALAYRAASAVGASEAGLAADMRAGIQGDRAAMAAAGALAPEMDAAISEKAANAQSDRNTIISSVRATSWIGKLLEARPRGSAQRRHPQNQSPDDRIVTQA